MIEQKRASLNTLKDYRDGKIPKGLGIGCELDDYVRFKYEQTNIILGHDNVGKSYWAMWYFLCLALRHDLKFVMLMDENKTYKVIRDMIQMYYGQEFMSLTHQEIEECNDKIESHFYFVDNRKEYKPEDVLKIFESVGDFDAGIIDPYNGLDSSFSYDINYKNMRAFRLFCKKLEKTIYVNCHPATASGRRGASYPESHDWAGHTMPPIKSDIEGGKPFTNKVDDFIIIHRLIDHRTMWFYTMVEVKKVKDTDTGGKQTWINEPVLCDYNKGCGFIVGGKDPLKGYRYHDQKNKPEQTTIKPNDNFEGFDNFLEDDTLPF